MSHRTSFIGLFAGASLGLLGIASASAADLDQFYGDPPPVPEQKVEFGSGWYVRGDMAVEQGYNFGLYQPPGATYTEYGFNRNHRLGYDFGLGGGYKFTNAFRADVTADMHQPATVSAASFCYNSYSDTCFISGSFRNYDALVNGYYDFGPFGIFTPYLGAGIGIGFGESRNGLYGGSETYAGNIGYHTLAFALMAGVSFDIYDHTKLDLGYRYLNSGHFEGTNLYNHQLRAGLRYMIDN